MKIMATLLAPLLSVPGICLAPLAAHSSDDAVAYQINASHSGNIVFNQQFTAPLKLKWSINLGAGISQASYPVIANHMVFVTAENSATLSTTLFALDLHTGATVWMKNIQNAGSFQWSQATYDHGRLFVLDYTGDLFAFDPKTGNTIWQTTLTGSNLYESAPTAQGGQIFIFGAGDAGPLYAINEANGSVVWTAPVPSGNMGTPAVGGGGVYLTEPCQSYKFDPKSGALLWTYSNGGDGGGGKTAAYFGGKVYDRDPPCLGYIVLDAKSGNLAGTFGGSLIPAFWKGKSSLEVSLVDSQLLATNLKSGNVAWTFAGDGYLLTAPIAVNDVVIEGSQLGNLYALDASNGKQLWATNVGFDLSFTDEQSPSILPGLGAGENTLVVPGGNMIAAYVPK